MEFNSERVRTAATLFQTISFGEARNVLKQFIMGAASPLERAETLALLFRIEVERDDPKENENIYQGALKLKSFESLSLGALYHLGVVFTLCEDPDSAEGCYHRYLNSKSIPSVQCWGEYGLAAVAYNRKESQKTLEMLSILEEKYHQESADYRCLLNLLRANCYRSLSRLNEALVALHSAQKLLPDARAFYLKHWVFFGMGSVFARLGDESRARTLFEIVLSLTHPVDFRRLCRLAQNELDRLNLSVELLFDPIRGDIVSQRGCLTLRGKPILISLLQILTERWPEPCSKESIYVYVWRGLYHPLKHDGLIYSHIQRLRQILASDGQLTDFVLTTAEGYQLNPDIRVRLKQRSFIEQQEIKSENHTAHLAGA